MVPGEKYGAPRSIAHQNDRKTVISTMRWYDSNHLWVLKELCVNLSLGCVLVVSSVRNRVRQIIRE